MRTDDDTWLVKASGYSQRFVFLLMLGSEWDAYPVDHGARSVKITSGPIGWGSGPEEALQAARRRQYGKLADL